MPELPEVECLSRAVRRVLKGATVTDVKFLRQDLRDPIPIDDFKAMFVGQVVEDVFRRSKYMLWQTGTGFGVIHLGMTGNMVCQDSQTPMLPHTHMILAFIDSGGGKRFLHFVDPRRFGRIACVFGPDFAQHSFFKKLGPEPLETANLGEVLWEKARRRKGAIKSFLMDAHVVVGVGNIYASEALFRAGIHPSRAPCRVSKDRYQNLGQHIQQVLRDAIKQGGTTFRDFRNVDGNPGYFRIALAVYAREGEPCRVCGHSIKSMRHSGRSTFYCTVCQS